MNYRILTVAAVMIFSFAFTSTEKLNTSNSNITASEIPVKPAPLSFKEEVKNLYGDFKAANSSMPALSVFEQAMKGYAKLDKAGRVANRLLTVIDFDMSSSKKRMWIMDMEDKKVLFNTFVSHGKNTGVEFANKFSNQVNSHQSSLGFYVTGETYYGKNGLSLFIDGMEKGFNSNARKRYVVIHGADYATKNFINRYGRLGRSYGCPAVPNGIAKDLINRIKGKSVVFIHKSDKKYQNKSSYLNYEA
ncbi:murein L,D-transpeptidase catalytic domain family protein [Salegentibacter chungangensis]|uniref:Murein L,D-transpeptidase catalytic domain family protein n=1 Tax=Salegentibacter chungangensis TaxID=1335724 RepID=A0ABW3NR64_9FLAO